jgi:LysM domain-containing protein
MIARFVRFVLILILVAAVFAGVAFYIITDDYNRRLDKFNFSVTLAIRTAVSGALFDATRTAESPIPHYRLITLGQNEFLADVAVQYHTTVDVLRMANALAPTVESGSGEQIVVPEGVSDLNPPRRLTFITAGDTDTLETIASTYQIPLHLLEEDNPILAQRGIIPGDIVFIAHLL